MRKYGVMLLMPVVMLAGCQLFSETVIPVHEPPQTARTAAAPAEPPRETMERRFSDAPVTQMDAIQSITTWAQRYDELSQKTEKLRVDNTQVTLDNARLQQEVERLNTELKQCRSDIDQSNALLQQAHLELSKWKADVLGYRDEMRQAQTAQLSALTKILRILGAETSAPSESAQAGTQEAKP